jgi:hypothetical protein
LFRNPPVILKIVPEAGYDTIYSEKISKDSEENRNSNSDATFQKILIIKKCFQGSQAKPVVLKYYTGSCLGMTFYADFSCLQCCVDTGENRPMTEKEASTEIMMRLPD